MPQFSDAFAFAARKAPPDHLRAMVCEGTVALRPVRSASGEGERSFSLCTRHADILWNLGFLDFAEAHRLPSTASQRVLGPIEPATSQ
jgi:hypothetical protein